MKRWCIAAAVLLVIAAGLVWWGLRAKAPRTFTLPDGSRVYFHGATVSRNASIDLGSPIEKLRRRLPRELGGQLIRNVYSHRSDQDMLVFWFELERMPAIHSYVTVEFVDEQAAQAFKPAGSVPPTKLGNGRVVAFSSFRDWPRWDKTLSVRIGYWDDDGRWNNLGEVTVRNPERE